MNPEKNEKLAENLSADELKISLMLKSLSRIEAPNDFDFRLKARIAARQGAKKSNFVTNFWRFSLPLFALVALVALFILYGNFLFLSENPQIVNVPEPQIFSVPENNPAVTEDTPMPTFSPMTAADNSKPELPKTSPKPPTENNLTKSDGKNPKRENVSGGSRDFAVKEAVPVQPNFNANVILQNQKNLEKNTPISIQGILSEIGLTITVENNKLVVKSVKNKSLAESSGIQEDDIVEAIDDEKVSPETIFRKRVEGKTITVLRKGRPLKIILKNR